MTYVKCMKRVPENGLPCQLQAGHKHGHSAEPSSAVPEAQNYASSMPHVNCTGPCCRPDLWKAAIKGSVTSEAQTVPIPEDLQESYAIACKQYPGHCGFVRGLIERIARDEATIAELSEKLGAINRITSPGNRTLDDFMRDMGYANDLVRAALARATGKES